MRTPTAWIEMLASSYKRLSNSLAIAIIVMIFALLIVEYLYYGPEWDLIAHYLNAKSILNGAFYTCFFTTRCIYNVDNSAIYFEPFRAPLSSAIIAIFIIVFKGYAIIAYLCFVLLLFIASIYFIAKYMELDALLAIALFATPFMLLYSLLSNGTEMLSLSFALLGMALLARKSPASGLLFGIASISKYIMLILFPLLLLLYKPKKIAIGLLLFFVPIIPWLIVSKIALGGYFASYFEIYSIASSSIFSKGISTYALGAIFASSAALGATAFAVMLFADRLKNAKKLFAKIAKNENFKIAVAFLALSALSYVAIAYKKDVFTQMRFGYALHGALSLAIAVPLSMLAKNKKYNIMPLAIAAVLILIIGYNFYHLYSIFPYKPALSVRNPVFESAINELNALGYGNCNVVSNDWIYMLYFGAHAFSPFSNFTSYPIVVFYNNTASTSPSFIKNLALSTPIYKSSNYSIMLPLNFSCVTAPPEVAR
ncbi:MAG: hypothetical protein ACP5K5_00695 [Candidatus Micrarchaeia archaeon]